MNVIWEEGKKLEEKIFCCQNVSTFTCPALDVKLGYIKIFILSQNVCILWEGILNIICKTTKNVNLQKDQVVDDFPSLQLSRVAELDRQITLCNKC